MIGHEKQGNQYNDRRYKIKLELLEDVYMVIYVRVASRNRTLGTLSETVFRYQRIPTCLLHYSMKFGSSGHFCDEEIVAKANVR